MESTTVAEPEKMIIGMEIRTTNENNQAATDIPKAWEKFYSENLLEKIPNKVSEEIYGLYTDYEGDHTKPYSLVIGCEVNRIDDIPPGMVAKTIPAANYAKFSVKGEFPKSLIEAWQEVWNSPLSRTFTGDFEVYGKNFHQDPPEVDLFIAIAG